MMALRVYLSFSTDITQDYSYTVLVLYLVNFACLTYSTWRIDNWKRRELIPLGYRRSCKYEGYFTALIVLFICIFILDIVVLAVIDEDNFVCLYPVFMVFSFATTLFLKVFMVKMSRAKWSDLPGEESDRQITNMDREVAAEWFDKLRPETDFRFA